MSLCIFTSRLCTAAISMTENKSIVAAGFTVDELVPKTLTVNQLKKLLTAKGITQ